MKWDRDNAVIPDNVVIPIVQSKQRQQCKARNILAI
jgi:hypothetical protein